ARSNRPHRPPRSGALPIGGCHLGRPTFEAQLIPHLVRRAAWVPWLLLGLTALVSCIGAPPPTVLARLFFVVTLGGALLVGLAAAGTTWQIVGAGALLVLTALQVTLHR